MGILSQSKNRVQAAGLAGRKREILGKPRCRIQMSEHLENVSEGSGITS